VSRIQQSHTDLAALLVLASRATHDVRARAMHRREAVSWFEFWWSSEGCRGSTLVALMEIATALGAKISDDVPVVRAIVSQGIREGIVLVIRRERRVIGAAPVEADEREIPTTTFTQETRTWITIRLVDESDPPRPVSYARYRIRLPDQSIHEGTLNADGIAHHADIDYGVCDVTFPDFDGDAWERVTG
jgi:hypothetical protein